MNLLKRPLKNIVTLDVGMFVWCGGWMFLLLAWAAPSGLVEIFTGTNINPFQLLFSFEFLKVSPEELENTTLAQAAIRDNLYTILNIGKVVMWILLSVLALGFLFKQPKGE
ncbi:hypothetical protein [Priestia megaterium]|uniref:hypothetical protein n=1 Tax=Priestia megaterium TaxID=1404 RepID=UPI000BFDD611|nr:hypothetical protein [Priestia megaterium]PGQ88170.1 hypothetical protein COA18_04400 [Priestia megaterium]